MPTWDYPDDTNWIHGGTQRKFYFDNGYGASVVCHSMSYGGSQGLYELAVLHGKDRDLCYASPITRDVIGYLTIPEVEGLLQRIILLPPNEDCDHDNHLIYGDDDEEDGELEN